MTAKPTRARDFPTNLRPSASSSPRMYSLPPLLFGLKSSSGGGTVLSHLKDGCLRIMTPCDCSITPGDDIYVSGWGIQPISGAWLEMAIQIMECPSKLWLGYIVGNRDSINSQKILDSCKGVCIPQQSSTLRIRISYSKGGITIEIWNSKKLIDKKLTSDTNLFPGLYFAVVSCRFLVPLRFGFHHGYSCSLLLLFFSFPSSALPSFSIFSSTASLGAFLPKPGPS